jgi:hypothetical protein
MLTMLLVVFLKKMQARGSRGESLSQAGATEGAAAAAAASEDADLPDYRPYRPM